MLFLLLFTIRESRATKLLAQKVEKLEKKYRSKLKPNHNPDAIPNRRALVQLVILRPARLAVTEPIVMMVAILNATAWGLVYLFTESLPVVYSLYGWAETTTSLPFIAIGLGIPFSILVRLWDLRVASRRMREKQDLAPEDKLMGFAIAAPALAIGLWLFSWTIPPLVHTHWAVSMVGLLLIGFAANEFAYTCMSFNMFTYKPNLSKTLTSYVVL